MTKNTDTSCDKCPLPRENGQCTDKRFHEVEEALLANGKGEQSAELCEYDVDDDPVPCLCSQRWILSYMGFCFGVVLMTVRINMSLALPYMVKPADPGNTTTDLTNVTIAEFVSNDTAITSCGSSSLQSVSSDKDAEFEWSKFVQSLILAGYFWGYIVTQVPGGWIAGKYGGKRVITVAISGSALLTLLTPVLARASPYAVVVVRFLLGLLAGFCMPSMFNLIGVWSQPTERSRMVGMVLLGTGLGTVFGIFTSGILCDKGFDNGWGSVFYIHGLMTVLFVFVWVYCVADSPMDHPRISEAEKRVLQRHHTKEAHVQRDVSVPWRRMLTYIPFWVICTTHGLTNFVVYLLCLCLPQFLKETMNFDMQSNGLFSSLPFLSNTIGLGIAGVLADKLISSKVLSTTAIRKLFQCTAFVGIAVMIIIPGYLDCTQVAPVIICLCGAMLFEALGQTAGYSSNVIDIAPRYASVIYGFSNSMGTVPGMVAPIIVAALTPNGTFLEWRTVFYITAICAVVGAVLFGGFASSELAPWAEEELVIHVPLGTGSVAQIKGGGVDDISKKNMKEGEIINNRNSNNDLHSNICDKLIDKKNSSPVVSL